MEAQTTTGSITESWGSTEVTSSPEFSSAVTSAVATAGDALKNEGFAALIGGAAGGVLLALVTISAVLLWYVFRQKGSYDTNETKLQGPDRDEGPDEEEGEEEEEEEGSDTELQSTQPLTTGTEEEH